MISSTALEKKTSRPYMKPMIQPSQIRAARAIIGLTQAALAAAAGISTTALNNIERGAADPKASTLGAIEKALRSAGVEFISENGGGAGVRLSKRSDGTKGEH